MIAIDDKTRENDMNKRMMTKLLATGLLATAWQLPAQAVERSNAEDAVALVNKAIDYLKKRAWTNDTVNKLIAWMTDNQATGEDGAKYFLKNNEPLRKDWVSPEAAEKIKASL